MSLQVQVRGVVAVFTFFLKCVHIGLAALLASMTMCKLTQESLSSAQRLHCDLLLDRFGPSYVQVQCLCSWLPNNLNLVRPHRVQQAAGSCKEQANKQTAAQQSSSQHSKHTPHTSHRNGLPTDAAGGAVRHAHDVPERGERPVLLRVSARPRTAPAEGTGQPVGCCCCWVCADCQTSSCLVGSQAAQSTSTMSGGVREVGHSHWAKEL